MFTPKEIAARWFTELWNNRNPEVIREFVGPDSKAHLEGGNEVVGPDEFLLFYENILTAFPDISFQLHDCMGDDTDACIRWTFTGTFAGSGTPVSINGTTWIRVKDQIIVEGWDTWNYDALARVMGVLE